MLDRIRRLLDRAEWLAFAEGLDEAALARRVRYRNSAGTEFQDRVEDVVQHVALHGSYHRGQLAVFARGEGGTPQATDYIAFVRGAPAAARPA